MIQWFLPARLTEFFARQTMDQAGKKFMPKDLSWHLLQVAAISSPQVMSIFFALRITEIPGKLSIAECPSHILVASLSPIMIFILLPMSGFFGMLKIIRGCHSLKS